MNLTETVTERLHRMFRIHFDREQGTPYWLQRQEALGIDVVEAIETIEDLALLGPMDEQALATLPVESFIPKRLLNDTQLLLAETGGTLGRPKCAVHGVEEFEQAFITPFTKAAARCGFPRDCHWLFIGPTGPHIIGKAARRCAELWGRGDVFAVDFDPRWVKKMVSGSFAAKRYLDHVLEQALRIMEVQRIGVIFSTPAVLAALMDILPDATCRAVSGIHLGGMSVTSTCMRQLETAFPNAVILSGFGNTLFGMMPHLAYDHETGMDYYPWGSRLVVRVMTLAEPDAPLLLDRTVDYGQRGRVLVHRLDERQLILNMVERDSAVRIAPRPDARAEGFVSDGLRDPQPIVNTVVKPTIGLY